jgi:hypothetical protein
VFLTKNPVDGATGKYASLTRSRYDLFNQVYTLCLDNGSFSGSGYNIKCFALQLQGPFSVSVQAGFHLTQLSGLPFNVYSSSSLFFSC